VYQKNTSVPFQAPHFADRRLEFAVHSCAAKFQIPDRRSFPHSGMYNYSYLRLRDSIQMS